MAEPSFSDRVLETVRAIPRGRVSTYGRVAALCGSPRAARGVGAVLQGGIDSGVPWWRVVNREGLLTIPVDLGLRTLQRTLLVEEGVSWDEEGRIRLERHLWPDPGSAEGAFEVD